MPRILIGDATTLTPRNFTEGIKALSKRFSSPTNAVACAALDSVFQVSDFDAGVRAGMSEIAARSFPLPWGILPRMELLACGWVKPGDEFKRATDLAWWNKRYAHPLWEPLTTYANLLDAASIGTPRAFDEEMARGNASAISRALTSAGENLDAIRKDGSDVCAPFFIPARAGVLPVRNDACQAALNGKKLSKGITDGIVNTIQKSRASVQFWIVAAVVIVLASRNRR